MKEETFGRVLLVATAVALGCSLVVSMTVYLLRPMQLAYEDLARNRVIVEAAGLAPQGSHASDRAIVNLFLSLETRIVDLETGQFSVDTDSEDYNQDSTDDPSIRVAIPEHLDLGRLGSRSRHGSVYLVVTGDRIERIVLPVHGRGMWSTIHGYVSLESDFNTIAGISFYEHGETPGIGDRIEEPGWRAQWEGRRLYDERGELRFEVTKGAASQYAVDAISGATVTAEAVGRLVRYWLGEHGYGPLLAQLRTRAPREN